MLYIHVLYIDTSSYGGVRASTEWLLYSHWQIDLQVLYIYVNIYIYVSIYMYVIYTCIVHRYINL